MSTVNPVDYFDKIAHTYSKVDLEATPGGRARRIRKARAMALFDKAGGKVLDVGCGPGVLVNEMLALNCEFWGVDGSPRMIEQCQRQFSGHERTHFAIGLATALPFASESFDAVTCLGVIDRIKHHETALKEMVRVLKQNGTLIVAVPNLMSPYVLWRSFIFNPIVALLRPLHFALFRKRRRPVMGPFAKLHSTTAYTSSVAAEGCYVTDVVYINFNLMLSPLDELFPGLSIRVADKAESLSCGRMKFIGAAFLVKAKKPGLKGGLK